MGAFDVYRGQARCPACRAIHFFSGQTKVFDPDFGEHCMRDLAVGRPQPVGFRPSSMLEAAIWEDEWWRVRARGVPGELTLLPDLGEQFACSCGRPLVTLLRFRLDDAAAEVELLEIELLDLLEDDAAARVDLADRDGMFDVDSPWDDVEELAAAPESARIEALRAALALRFEGHETWFVPPPAGFTWLIGQARCEACGDARERRLWTMYSHPGYVTSIFGEGWAGGVLRPGSRIGGPSPWRERDEDRGYYLRLRHPLPARSLTLCEEDASWACACGAGPVAVVAHFRVDDAGLTLASIALRSVRSLADLADVDLVCAPRCVRALRLREGWGGVVRQPKGREEALACLARRFGG
ncbi:MAG: hypothetical protein H6711_00805 [Myxococcales bacterium]|nr:hypothetical protein [Myxococcales bacterium]